jgi:hypothetical protein
MSNPIQRLDVHGPALPIGRVRHAEREEDFQQELADKDPKRRAAPAEEEDDAEEAPRRDEDKACGPRLPDEAGGQIDLTA